MSEPFIAGAQYDDLIGTIAIDGHETGGFLDELAANAEIPGGYWPIGFEMWNAVRTDSTEDGTVPLTIVAVRCDQVGESAEEMLRYNADNGELPIYRFESQIDFSKLRSLMKRLDIKVRSGWLRGVNMVVYPS